jgi:hypothetical protein
VGRGEGGGGKVHVNLCKIVHTFVYNFDSGKLVKINYIYRFPRSPMVTSIFYVVPKADAKQVVAAPIQAMQINMKFILAEG